MYAMLAPTRIELPTTMLQPECRDNFHEAAPRKDDFELTERPEHTFADGLRYTGQWSGGQPNGEGLLIFPDGRKYHGEFQDGKFSGTGSCIADDGSKYVGPWVQSVAHGHMGFCSAPNGAFYHGAFENGFAHGEGSLTIPDKSIFVGQFNCGLKSGRGREIEIRTSFLKTGAAGRKKTHDAEIGTYDGEFVDNCFHGEGIYKWRDGRQYEGQWQMNRMHGRGKYIFDDGRRYEGQYVQGEKSGVGTYAWPDGRKYEGQVLRGAQHGTGVYTNASGKSWPGVWQHGRRAALPSTKVVTSATAEIVSWI